MVNNFKPVQAQNFSLSGAGAIAGATSVILKSFAQIDGTLLTMTDFGTIGFATIEPGNGTLEEQISFTGVTQNANGTATLTGVSTILMVSPYTSSSGLAQTHAGSTTLVLSNTSGYYDQFLKKNVDATITGLYTFPNGAETPILGASYVAPTLNNQVASKGYADSLTFAGAPDATTTQKGIVELATQSEVDAKTATGGTGAALVATPDLARSTLLSDYVVDTGAANAYVIAPSPTVTAFVAGQRFSFKVKTTNTTSSTLVVNALSGTAIFKEGGSTNLAAGDLVAGQIAEVEYNGINGFQLMSPVGNTAATQAFVSSAIAAAVRFGGSGSDGALALTSGATNIDLAGASLLVKNYSSISITGTGQLTFTNPHANGTVIILKSVGDVTLTSSASPNIEASGLGANGGAGAINSGSTESGTIGSTGNPYYLYITNPGAPGVGSGPTVGAGGALPNTIAPVVWASSSVAKYGGNIWVGAGGGGGGRNNTSGGTGGDGGKGGGGLIIECGGALNYTATIFAKGNAGSNAGAPHGGGGGGGGGGLVKILYNTVTANSGTTTVTGGAGGSGVSDTNTAGGGGGNTNSAGSSGSNITGGAGATGYVSIEKNTDYA